jgi:hypothetical protein
MRSSMAEHVAVNHRVVSSSLTASAKYIQGVVQLAERLIWVQEVVGSSPIILTSSKTNCNKISTKRKDVKNENLGNW